METVIRIFFWVFKWHLYLRALRIGSKCSFLIACKRDLNGKIIIMSERKRSVPWLVAGNVLFITSNHNEYTFFHKSENLCKCYVKQLLFHVFSDEFLEIKLRIYVTLYCKWLNILVNVPGFYVDINGDLIKLILLVNSFQYQHSFERLID